MTGLTARRWGLSGAEWATTAVAAVVSSTAYVLQGAPYLARGVVGDLLVLLLLALVAGLRGTRVRHEALLCLGGIGVVVLASPDWPLQRSSAFWWTAFSLGLLAYLGVRARVTR